MPEAAVARPRSSATAAVTRGGARGGARRGAAGAPQAPSYCTGTMSLYGALALPAASTATNSNVIEPVGVPGWVSK
jgi:hypothetical protein